MTRAIWGQGLVVALSATVATVLMSSEAEASLALVDWNMEARRSLPLHLKARLGAMLFDERRVDFLRKETYRRKVGPRCVYR